MPYNPYIHNRRSIRLKGYDYTKAGLYFITLVCKNRAQLFGKIINKKMILNELGKIADKEWLNTINIRKNIILHEHIIMPDHMHGIIEIVERKGEGEDDVKGVWPYAPTAGLQSPSKTIGAIIRGYKGAVTKQINIKRKTPGTPVWQRNYWESIIRDKTAYHRIAEYIQNNPRNWKEDKLKNKL